MYRYYFKNEETGNVINSWDHFVEMINNASAKKEVDAELGGLNVLSGEYEYSEHLNENAPMNVMKFFFMIDAKEIEGDVFKLKNGKVLDLRNVQGEKESLILADENELCRMVYFISNSCEGKEINGITAPLKIAPKLKQIRDKFEKEQKEKNVSQKQEKQFGEE